MEHKTVIVIGAVNMDICGRPGSVLRLRDSNIGTVSLSPGGVGRNIAHALRLLDVSVRLCAAVGDDVYGESLYKSCLELGMDMSLAPRVRGGTTSCYLYVTDETGEMLVGIADTDIAEQINPAYLGSILDDLNAADAVVIDGNLPAETVRYIAENVTAPLFADPVSGAKAEKLRPALPKLCAFKPNAMEAMSLTGEDSPEAAARALSALGTKRVFVSLGAEGMLAREGETEIKLPCELLTLVNTTGCGDAAAAAIIWATVNGFDLEKTAKAALHAAALTAQCPETVCAALSAGELEGAM